MQLKDLSVPAICSILGDRLKKARLNKNLTQTQLAESTGLSKKKIIAAESGNARLDTIVAILAVLNQYEAINSFIPDAPYSPIQLMKLKGKRRQRASGAKIERETKTLDW